MDDVTALTQESEALLADVYGTQMALTVFPSRLRAIEAAAARRAIEGSMVVSVEAVAPAINGMLSTGWLMDSLTEPVGWEGEPNPHQWLHDAIVAAGKAVDAALPRPEEPRVERKVAKDIDAAVDELERLFHPEGRCAMCGGGRPYWKHDMGTYSDHPEGHPFAPEVR